MCDFYSETQSSEHIFSRCPFFVVKTMKLLDSINEIVFQGKEDSFVSFVSFGSW